jgi:hypothetical protein
MEADMLHGSMVSAASDTRTLVERVRDAVASLGSDRVWARYVGPHVLLGLRGDDAFARVTPLGGGSYGLAFRSVRDAVTGAAVSAPRWEPMFLVDELADVVEHALVAVDALPM